VRITAAVTESQGAPFALQELELGEPHDDEVLVEVAAAGICHTDLIVRDQWYPVPLPAVLGHEGAGSVVKIGRRVSGVSVGDRVAMTFHSCGTCSTCRSGKPSYCRSFFEHNFGASRPADGSSALSRGDGPVHAHFFGQSSFGTHAMANERNVVKVDDGVPLEVAAPFGCGIQTGAGAIFNVLRPPAGSSIAIFGVGSVGLAAVAASMLAGCTTIVAVDLRRERLDVARELGATAVVDASAADPVAGVREATGGGADYSIEATGSAAVLRQAVDCTGPTGVCGVIGAPAFGTEVSLDVNTVLIGGRTVRGIVEGDSVPQVFLPRLVELWKQGRFPVERFMAFYDFDQIEEAAHDAEAGRVIKSVLRMS
jgi:aryl-alcohol dehydrogenase